MDPADVAQANEIDLGVGAKIRLRRKALGISQKQLARAIGVCFQQIQKYENASNRVSASNLWEISQALYVPVTYFFDDTCEATRGSLGNAQTALLACPGGAELADLFPRVELRKRRGLLELMRALVHEAS
ncbi:helix-turn-helix transcriptional regulator [Phenylobacterium sp. LjRoot219]|uniref:helix-turn-helix domain-containing protein n=1 Tax=Phenylobacterium sp. LjRoot219 TaxID=3342283 RepID=UPI003ED00DFF